MPISPTRYIDAGPGVPLANPQSAMIQGEAMARMGATIQHFGAIGFEVAEKVRKIDENRKITASFAQMEKEASDFSLGLMRREDTEAWSADWQAKSTEWKDRAKEIGLSPDGMAAFEDRFQRWNTQHTIGFETKAANKAIELGIGTLKNSQAFHLNNRNYGAAIEDLESAHAAGLLTLPEMDAAMMDVQAKEKHNGFLDDINEDARGWAEKNAADKPAEGYDPVRWRQLHDYASGIAREQDGQASDQVVDGIVTGNLSTHDAIKAAAPGLRPAQHQKLFDALDHWNREGARELRADPKHMAANVGKFYSALSDWKPDAEGADPAGVELRMLIEDLPEGHPLRDKMKESMTARKNRIEGEVKTRMDQGLSALKDVADLGHFGPVKLPEGKPIETRKAVADGFLKDVPKQQALGFSEDQAKEIRKAAMKDEALGQAKFRELWKDRPQNSVNATPFDLTVADALRLENPTLNWKTIPSEELDAHERAVRSYGDAVIDFTNWSKMNPDATEDQTRGKLRELGSKSARLTPISNGPVKAPPARPAPTTDPNAASDALLPPKPGGKETSMALPKGTRTTAYGYAGDPTPDSNSSKGIGSFTTDADAKASPTAPTRLKAGDIAVSPDIERNLVAAGVKPRDTITVMLADGTKRKGRWMDRTADYLTGRMDFYSPDGVPENDGTKVVGWSL